MWIPALRRDIGAAINVGDIEFTWQDVELAINCRAQAVRSYIQTIMNFRTVVKPAVIVDLFRLHLRRRLAGPIDLPQKTQIPYGDFVLTCDSAHHLPQILA